MAHRENAGVRSHGSRRCAVHARGAADGVRSVTNEGAWYPSWSQTAPELLYGTLDQRIMTIRYQVSGGTFVPSTARLWSKERCKIRGALGNRSYALHPDGKQRALAIASTSADEMRRLSPARR